jgi:trans-AT polyketide synthase/acyltransferase/oxidoreductase domain-containing protein
MFSGQGAQYYRMGERLYETDSEFRKVMDRLDKVALSINRISILEKLYDPSMCISSEFNELRYTHPAIYMLEYSIAHTLVHRGVTPSIVLGSSLGEVVAAAVAGCIDPDEAMDFVVRQAEIFESYAERGGMTAILAEPEIYDKWHMANRGIEIAAINYTEHFVVSGGDEQLNALEADLKKEGLAFQRLPVNQAFHSSKIKGAQNAFLKLCKRYVFGQSRIPVISSTMGRAVNHVDGDYLWKVVRQVIQFPLAVKTAERMGGRHFYDLGPSGTMANFAKRCLKHADLSSCEALLSPFAPSTSVFEKLIRQNTKPNGREQDMSITNTTPGPSSRVFMFPGQGSQKVGMGNDLFDKYPEICHLADKILGYSIKELCISGPENKLGNTQYTQPALYTVSALAYMEKIKSEPEPDVVMGHSLGEFNALFAAGVFNFEDGLRLVKKRGELMASMSNGGMIAVINHDHEKIREVMDSNNIEDIDFANYNSPSQIVLAGPEASLKNLPRALEEAGAVVIPLNVSAPFHSRYMQEVQSAFSRYMEEFTFTSPNKTVISNVYAQPYDSSQIKRCLAMQISSPVRWSDGVQYLLNKGVNNFQEIGPGNVLKNLLVKIQSAIPVRPTSVDDTSSSPMQALIDTINEPQDMASENRNEASLGLELTAEILGSSKFKQKYGIKYAYATGAMYKGIASKELVTRMARSGFLSFFGTGGLSDEQVASTIDDIRRELSPSTTIGMNLVCNLANPDKEMRTIQLFLQKGINVIEAAAFLSVTQALVLYRLKGLSRDSEGRITASNRIMAKISRPEIAEQFLKPAPAHIVDKLLENGLVTASQADIAKSISMADSLCVEADSGGHTDMGVLSVILPSIIRLRDRVCSEQNYTNEIDVGAAGGIGTPESAASAFMLGADFILTGSINQCSPEAGTSDAVKDLLQDANIHDTRYAPAGDMFEIGAKVQVLKKGVFFPSRANKLYDLWQRYNAWEEIDEATRDLIQKKYFKRSFEDVYRETRDYYNKVKPQEIQKAEKNSKHKMALVFRWYFVHTNRIAISGAPDKVDYQIHCGPSLGAFNQWVKGTKYESWRNRHVDEIALLLLGATADYFSQRYGELFLQSEDSRSQPLSRVGDSALGV